jgi:hypothetical protein
MKILKQDNPTFRYVSPRTWIRKTNYPDLDFKASLAFRKQREDLLKVLQSVPQDGSVRLPGRHFDLDDDRPSKPICATRPSSGRSSSLNFPAIDVETCQYLGLPTYPFQLFQLWEPLLVRIQITFAKLFFS